ncbi:zinc ABC transporter substrate-binding protein [Marinobacter zhejiangensis]|uniref:High-affinity zinc uptake system protein ZnuA n=1 Tax=Marinobacter zhejiangensis TaxID=488535 RepID=A0A1I4NUL5_9GAMM|nr:zinc ABC transporter substrate-binding protein [Marinobacter zhejiangensis]SFM19218.1 zinc transport system substrate-binding protein [Marinobacter zhejiangensis]
MRFTKTLAAALISSAGALTSLHTQAAELQVVTSLKPLELLVRAIADDKTEVTSLVPPGASPHTYQMRPSQRRLLEEADRIFWVGPDMETFLVRLLAGEEFSGRQVALAKASEDGHHDDHDTENSHEPAAVYHDEHDAHEESGHHDHDHGDGEDPHIWIDPELALTMAHDIHDQLAQLPGVDTNVLDANLARFESNLQATELDIRARLAAAQGISLFTYHDAFRRFAEHYGLEIAGVLTLNPERSPGARHMAELQQQLKASPSPCLLTEPQFNRQWWHSITQGIDIRVATWDPLASDIDSSATGYLEFQQSMATAVLSCLPEQAQH